MSPFTALLGAVALVIIGLDAYFRPVYLRRRAVSPPRDSRVNWHRPVSRSSLACAALAVIVLMGVALFPVFMPDTALTKWMNEPYATAVLLGCIVASMTFAGWIVAICAYIAQRRMRDFR